MLTNYSLDNFKSFSSNQSFDLAKLTLIYGQNSSGKSSIIQSLLLLKQTLLGRDKHAGMQTSGNHIGLASPLSLINKHNSELDVGLSFSFKNQLSLSDYRDKLKQSPPFGTTDTRHLSIEYGYTQKGNDSASFLNELNYCATQNKSNKTIVSFCIKNTKNRNLEVDSPSNFHFVERDGNNLFQYLKNKPLTSNNQTDYTNSLQTAKSDDLYLSNTISLPVKSSNKIAGEAINSKFDSFFAEVNYEFEGIKYLGPLRSYPKRFYSSRQGKDSIGKSDFSDIFNTSNPSLINKINDWFSKFEIPYTLSVENVGNKVTGTIISIQLTDKRNGTTVTPADVGFGIGQVLPIIIEAVICKNSIICVEQPEIHLHPRLQAHLADLFIESTNAENNNQWIIETHSEALMLRIQRRIRSKSLEKSNVKVVYVQAGDNGSSIQNLPLDDSGRFLVHWPEGFFEERLNEQFGE